ncbi:cytochrome c [Acuticoccus sp. MNP-M23]|mgnify:CR=1 FL=1|uniref:c-type cytochrome n=1 Tax=Acuticoccus sp. MNP-M23 TaxID=3072793 RepID=UPI002815C674|nr:cytochrome c [Acuticoccus sp. MNP-M23]WMS44396.1 cytochrome c [Acuticoccus sp. MNP-M23]
MQRAIILICLGVAIGAGGIALVALWPGAASDAVVLRPGDDAVVALGATVYAAQCASCHGANLEGEPNWRERGPDGRLPAPPHDETGHTWHHPDAMLFELTKYGLPKQVGNGEPYFSNMPAYEGVLSDEEIVAVLSYIKSRWPQEVRARHDALNERMEAQ